MGDRKARRLQALHLGSGIRTHWIWDCLERLGKLGALLAVFGALAFSFYLTKALRSAGERMARELDRGVAQRPLPAPLPAERPRSSDGLPRPLVPKGRPRTPADQEAFSEASYLSGGLGPPTLERVTARVRAYYQAYGVKDEAFIAMNALYEADRGYQDALVEAERLTESGDAAGGAQRLQAGLKEQDPRHLVARLRLLEALEATAEQARDPALARRALDEAEVLREQIVTLTEHALAASSLKEATSGMFARELEQVKKDLRTRHELTQHLAAGGTPMDALANMIRQAAK